MLVLRHHQKEMVAAIPEAVVVHMLHPFAMYNIDQLKKGIPVNTHRAFIQFLILDLEGLKQVTDEHTHKYTAQTKNCTGNQAVPGCKFAR